VGGKSANLTDSTECCWLDYDVCEVCGRDNLYDEEEWGIKGLCPGCLADRKADSQEWRSAARQQKKQ